MIPTRFRSILALLVYLLVASGAAMAQGFDISTSIGAPQTVYHGGQYDNVDLQSGNAGINIPLVHLPGRGLDSDIIFTLNSKVWTTDYWIDIYNTLHVNESYTPNMGSLLGHTSALIGLKGALATDAGPQTSCIQWTYIDGNAPQCNSGYVTMWSRQSYDGANVQLIGDGGGSPLVPPAHANMWATDNSYRRQTGTDRTVHFKDGHLADTDFLEDANGNRISGTFNSVGSSGYGDITYLDTLSRSVSISHIDTSSLTSTVTYPDSSGATQTIHIAYSYVHVVHPCVYTSYYCQQYRSADPSFGDSQWWYLPASIQLPNGDTYTIAYGTNSDGTSTGEVSKLTLPTGGYIRYSYADHSPQNDSNGDDITAPFGELRVVTARTLSSDGSSSGEKTWSYQIEVPDPTYSVVSRVIDPLGNVHTESFVGGTFGVPTAPDLYGSSVQHFSVPGISVLSQDADNTGSVLKKITRTPAYDNGSYSYTGLSQYAAVSDTNARVASETTVLDDGEASTTSYGYENYGNTTSESVSDWSSSGTGPTLRTVNTSYWIDSHSNYDQDAVFHVDMPSDVSTYGNCGSGGTALCSRTQSVYDGYSSGRLTSGLLGTSNVAQHDYTAYGSGFTARGNLTQVTTGNGVNGGSSTVDKAYDDLGNVVAMMDGNGNVTSYDYTDAFYGAQPTSSTRAFVTKVTRPSTNTVAHIERGEYYLGSGLIAAHCGENFPSGQSCAPQLGATQADYSWWSYDALNRTTGLNTGDGGYTHLSYPDANHVAVSNAIGFAETYAYDGLGRQTSTDITSVSPEIRTDTSYDPVGRVYTKSNPYWAGFANSSDGTTTFTYDGIGRKIVESEPGDSNSSPQQMVWAYTGSSTANRDEGGSVWTRRSDALGRLTSVQEPNGASTSYTVDALGNVLNITQYGLSGETSRSRFFSYDSLSRLVISNNPETGVICYGQGSASNCNGGYDANSNLLYKTDARGITTSYGYDSLNRLTGKSYSDGTPGEGYAYDTAPSWMSDSTNLIGRLANTANSFGGGPSGKAVAATYSYNAMGQIVRKWEQTPSVSPGGVFFYVGYDLAGNMTDLTYPDGQQVNNRYDSLSRITSVYSGTTANPIAPYVTTISYGPLSKPRWAIYGNGVLEGESFNPRQQLCESYATQPGSLGGNLVYDRLYFYDGNNSTSHACQAATNDNGNIRHIVDAVDGNYTSDFNYDALNRLTQWSAPNMSSAYRSQVYNYDSFGNLWQSQGYSDNTLPVAIGTPAARMFPSVSSSWTPGNSSPYTGLNQLGNSFHDCLPSGSTGLPGQVNVYDLGGNLLCSGSSTDFTAKQYLWDGASRIAQMNTQHFGTAYYKTSEYVYDLEGGRARSTQYDAVGNMQSWREYLHFNGKVMRETDNTGGWANYVYAGSKRVARIKTPAPALFSPLDPNYPGYSAIVMHSSHAGTSCGGCTVSINSVVVNGINYPASSSSYNSDCAGYDPDSDTQLLNCAGDETLVVPSPVTSITVNASATPNSSGQYPNLEILLNGEIVDNPMINSGVTAYTVNPNLHYYIGDQLETTQLELSATANVTWQGSFAPFGQELDTPDETTSRFKFTGKERDQESGDIYGFNGLDYFGARYYSSSMGRWLSADWADKPEAVPYSDLDTPQSLNLYNYVNNNPLSHVDADGHADRAHQLTSRIVTGVAGGVNLTVGISKQITGVAEAIAAPETFGAAGIAAAYQLYQAHGQMLAGTAQLAGALSGNVDKANDVADALTLGTSGLGMATLAITKDKDLAGFAATMEGVITGAATRTAISSATNIIDTANNLFSGASQAQDILKKIPLAPRTGPKPTPPSPRLEREARPDKQGNIPDTANPH